MEKNSILNDSNEEVKTFFRFEDLKSDARFVGAKIAKRGEKLDKLEFWCKVPLLKLILKRKFEKSENQWDKEFEELAEIHRKIEAWSKNISVEDYYKAKKEREKEL